MRRRRTLKQRLADERKKALQDAAFICLRKAMDADRGKLLFRDGTSNYDACVVLAREMRVVRCEILDLIPEEEPSARTFASPSPSPATESEPT